MSNMSRVAAQPPAMDGTKTIGARMVQGFPSIRSESGMRRG
jgi:hypothetical protein